MAHALDPKYLWFFNLFLAYIFFVYLFFLVVPGEIRIGPSHQACMPPLAHALDPKYLALPSPEDIQWLPDSISDLNLKMYLRAARSMAAYAGEIFVI